MDRLLILAPALVLVAVAVVSFAVFCLLSATGRPPRVTGMEGRDYTDVVGPFVIRWMLWVLHPIEAVFVRLRVAPNVLTFTSLLVCAGAGIAIALGFLATGAWLYVFAGLLDILDGRLARATGQQSRAGAFLDSVADRWGELFVFSGFAWLLHDSPWLPAVMFAVAGSVMVSYTRARGEALGVELNGGTMQRAERIALVAIGTLATSFFDADKGTSIYRDHVLGGALTVVAVASTATALHRWIKGYRVLEAREVEQREAPRDPAAVKVPMKPKQRPAA